MQKGASSQQKKNDVSQESISCQQKQDDTIPKKYFVPKKFISIFQNGAPY